MVVMGGNGGNEWPSVAIAVAISGTISGGHHREGGYFSIRMGESIIVSLVAVRCH